MNKKIAASSQPVIMLIANPVFIFRPAIILVTNIYAQRLLSFEVF